MKYDIDQARKVYAKMQTVVLLMDEKISKLNLLFGKMEQLTLKESGQVKEIYRQILAHEKYLESLIYELKQLIPSGGFDKLINDFNNFNQELKKYVEAINGLDITENL